LSHRWNNRAIVRLIAIAHETCLAGALFFLVLQAQQRGRMDRHRDSQAFVHDENRTAIALHTNRSTGQPLRRRGAKSDNEMRAYRLDLLK
jgi:hypothetical protein